MAVLNLRERESNSRKSHSYSNSRLFKPSVVSLVFTIAIGVMELPLLSETGYASSTSSTPPPPAFPTSALAGISIPPNCYPSQLTPRSNPSIAFSPPPYASKIKPDRDSSSAKVDHLANTKGDDHGKGDHDKDHHGSGNGHYVMLFGGKGPLGPLNDTWSWNGNDWQQLRPSTSPPALYDASMAYAPGHHGKSANHANDHGKENNTAPAKTIHSDTHSTRSDHPSNGRGNGHDVVLFGGSSGNGPLNDTWSWNDNDWQQLHPATSPSPLSGTASTYDPSTAQAIFVGGSNAGNYSSTTWSWNGTTWKDAGSYGSITAPLGSSQFPTYIADMVSTPDGKGYWLVGINGSIYTFGDANYYGSLGGYTVGSAQVPAPIVAMASTPDGKGYWLLGSNGSVYTFGDAYFYGSADGIMLGDRAVSISSTPDGHGYWITDNTGNSYALGDAPSLGHISHPVNSAPNLIISSQFEANANGYWAADELGGVYTSNTPYYDSLSNQGILVSSMSSVFEDQGYYLNTYFGYIYPFGPRASFYGNAGWYCVTTAPINNEQAIFCLSKYSSYPLEAMAVTP